MNSAATLADHLVEFIRENKPTLRQLPIPQYVDRLLEEIKAAGFTVRKRADAFKPNPKKKDEYLRKVQAWAASVRPEDWSPAFPGRDIATEVNKAVLWLRAQAEAGKYKSRLDQFLHNWLSRSTPAATATVPSGKTYSSPRERAITMGLRELAASRSERVYPSDMEIRISLAMQDLAYIPEADLSEVFRKARALPMKSTPGLLNLHESWQALQAERRRKANEKSEEEKREKERLEDQRWAAMSPEERADEMERIRTEIAGKLK